MSPSAILYLLGMGLLLVGERLIGGADPKRWILSAAGLIALLGSLAHLGLQRQRASDPHRASALVHQLFWGLLGLASVALYAASTDSVLSTFGLEEEAEHRAEVVLTVAWLVVWLIATLPFLAADRALTTSPKVVTLRRQFDTTLTALATSLALATLFPLNYLATQHNKRWDLGYFKTAAPGSSTTSMVDALTDPVRAVLFFPTSSDVTQEVRTYFEALHAGNLSIEYADQALEPELAKDLKIRENGIIALVRGEGDDRQIETIKLGTDFDSAKRNLKKLDEKVQESLVKLTRGKRKAYVTVGHGEFYWKAGDPKERTLDTFKKALGTLQYKVAELGIASGLAQEVPEDADVVAIIGPTEAFLPEEIAALNAWRRQGGALLVAMEPGGSDLSGLLGPMGLSFHGEHSLVSDQNILAITQRKSDRLNIGTNKFSTHESVTTLSRNAKSLPVLTPSAGYLEEVKDQADPNVKVTVTVKSMAEAWVDENDNLELDSPPERRESRPEIAAVSGPVEGGEEGAEFRAVVSADASWLSDVFLGGVQGNAVMLLDTMSWLVKDPSLAGTVNNEEDVKIQHTREGQGWIFYGTSTLLPLGFLLGGLAWVSSRRNRGVA